MKNATKEITIWSRWNSTKKEYEHNHIENGFDEEQEFPSSINEIQKKSWINCKWKKEHGYLDGIVVKRFY